MIYIQLLLLLGIIFHVSVSTTQAVPTSAFDEDETSQDGANNPSQEGPQFITTALPRDGDAETTDQLSADTQKSYYAWYGIMAVRRTSGGQAMKYKTCTSFYPEISDMAQNESSAEFYPVLDMIEWMPCYAEPPIDNITGHLVLLDGTVDNSSCTLLDAATAAQGHGAVGTIFVRDEKPPTQNTSDTVLWLSFISNDTYHNIVEGAPDLVEAAVYSPREEFAFNYSLVIIWLLAVVTVTIGAYWSGLVRHRLYQESIQGTLCVRQDNAAHSPEDEEERPAPEEEEEEGEGRRGSKTPVYYKEETAMDISPKVALLFVLLMCVMLVSLYFLYEYLVYMIIGMFCLASVGAVYGCLEPLVLAIPCGTCKTPYFNLWLVRGQLEVRHLLLLVFAVSLTVTWVVLRNQPYAWVLQDILGMAFCINMLRIIRLPSLKICTILLSCLFVYDIFFVFITPLFTSDGNSIMVQVAQGTGPDGEQLPMVFRVPHLAYSEVLTVCKLANDYNLLGFGDVLVPGLLVAFLHSYDLRSRGKKFPLYFTVNIIAYGIGLCLTFVGLYLMRGAQPALLYLVPCTLLPTVIIAAIRGDLAEMWRGDSMRGGEDQATDKEESEAVTAVVAEQPTETRQVQ